MRTGEKPLQNRRLRSSINLKAHVTEMQKEILTENCQLAKQKLNPSFKLVIVIRFLLFANLNFQLHLQALAKFLSHTLITFVHLAHTLLINCV